jgi:hypothetical protein
VEEYRLKEMATSLLEEVVELAVERANIDSMVRLVTEYGPGTRNKLELELKRQRREEMEAIKLILNEGERELRLEYEEKKRNAWKGEYHYIQNNILILSMKELNLQEVMVMEVDEECIQTEDSMYMEPEDGAVEVLKVMEVDGDSIHARMEEDIMHVEPEEGAMEVMMIEDKTAVSLEIDAEVMEESVVGLESQVEYLHHHCKEHTLLPGPATIIENDMELGQVITE